MMAGMSVFPMAMPLIHLLADKYLLKFLKTLKGFPEGNSCQHGPGRI
jgi:hypothetical protein